MLQRMSDYMELAQYHKANPDPTTAGCLNTGKSEDGVVFPGIEPAEAAMCFVGRSSLYEAMASMHEITVKEVIKRMGGDSSKPKIAELQAEVDSLREKLEKYEKFAESAEEAGLIITALE